MMAAGNSPSIIERFFGGGPRVPDRTAQPQPNPMAVLGDLTITPQEIQAFRAKLAPPQRGEPDDQLRYYLLQQKINRRKQDEMQQLQQQQILHMQAAQRHQPTQPQPVLSGSEQTAPLNSNSKTLLPEIPRLLSSVNDRLPNQLPILRNTEDRQRIHRDSLKGFADGQNVIIKSQSSNPSLTEVFPPPLPPPRHVDEYRRNASEPGWQWGSQTMTTPSEEPVPISRKRHATPPTPTQPNFARPRPRLYGEVLAQSERQPEFHGPHTESLRKEQESLRVGGNKKLKLGSTTRGTPMAFVDEAEVVRAEILTKGEKWAQHKPSTEVQLPIKFTDAVGRKFSFPWHLCNTWKGMEELIKQAFIHIDVVGSFVQLGHYDLKGPEGQIILPQVWETMVEPDWTITMHMWPMPEPHDLKSHQRTIKTRVPRKKAKKKKKNSNTGPPPPPPPPPPAPPTPPMFFHKSPVTASGSRNLLISPGNLDARVERKNTNKKELFICYTISQDMTSTEERLRSSRLAALENRVKSLPLKNKSLELLRSNR